MEKGPKGDEAAGEIDEEPEVEDVRATLRWAMETENVEMVDFVFNDEHGPVIQHFGSHIHITGIPDDKIDVAKEILKPHAMDTTELEIQRDAAQPYLDTVELDADVQENMEILKSLFEELYDNSLSDLSEIRRSTYSTGDEETETAVATCSTCGDEYEVELVMEGLSAEYYTLVGEESGSVGEDLVDMIWQNWGEKWECKICFDEK
jgi:hypothetical protein